MQPTMTHTLDAAVRDMRQLGRGVIRGSVEALNDLADDVGLAEGREMRSVFDRPTPWTLGAIRKVQATQAQQTAEVRIRGKADVSGSVVPPSSFLAAEIDGGRRRFKRFERLLFAKGVLPAGYWAVPAAGARLDGYGNMSAGHIIELIAWFEAFPSSGSGRRANSTEASRARRRKGTRKRSGVEYFAVKPGQRGLPPGIYERRTSSSLGRGIRPVMLFSSRVVYARRFDFFRVADETINARLPARMAAALTKAGV